MDDPPGRSPEPLPDAAFEDLLRQVVDQAAELADSQAKLQALVRATEELAGAPLDLELATVLRRIAQTAAKLVDARYGAIRVVGADRVPSSFVQVGPEAPRTESSLEVPIRVQGAVYGNLHLADAAAGTFTSDDEELVQALAATAGVAIANAHLYQDATYRGTWSTALVETARILMAGDDDPIELLLETARRLSSADLVCLAQPGPTADQTTVTHAVGRSHDHAIGLTFPTAGSLAATAIRRGEAVVVDDLHAVESYGHVGQAMLGHTLVIPFRIGDGTSGVLFLTRTREHGRFDVRDTDMAHSVAAHVGMAMAQEKTRAAHRRLALLEERERIARDLHDHVIQRLFATGLSLSSVTNGMSDRDAAARVLALVAEIDHAIVQIRQTIFTIRTHPDDVGDSLRSRIQEIADGAAVGFDVPPAMVFRGPVSLLADADLADDLVAVVREGLSNAVRHGRARSASVLISADGDRISVTVSDDGIGVGAPRVVSGLANLRRRAEHRGGTLDVGPGPDGGTVLSWSVPL
jgi:signal transduction histidine kinase